MPEKEHIEREARYIDTEIFAERLMNAWDTADEQKRADIVAVMANIVTPILVGTPTADVVEVKHGSWKLHKDGSGTCDQCHGTARNVWDYDGWQNYCGRCGSRMMDAQPIKEI